MGSEEEKGLEEQLELQLQEQKDSLTAITDALASDPSNPELLSVQEELVQVIKDAEEGLLHLKRARLLREADSVLRDSTPASEDVKVEPLDPADAEPEPLEDCGYSIGSKCRFRYTDGQWYDGEIIDLPDPDTARISFLRPTTENMLICKFFLQQRCRYGSNCRSTHGFDVSLSSLKKFIPTSLDKSLVGSSVWALSDGHTALWREAELESWDDELGMGQVVFCDDGSSTKVGSESMTLSQYALMSDEEETDSNSDYSDSSDDEEEGAKGLGFLDSTNQQRGIQMETAIFARWEHHTRGVASKMMANMGYREGMGLGASGQGMLNPIPVKVLPAKQSLDHALESQKGKETKEHRGKKRSRGGKRKREKKLSLEARAAKDEEEQKPDVFSLINTQLAMHNEALKGASSKKQSKESGEKKVDRRALLAYEDEVKELRARIEKLEEMANRNRKEKVVYEAAIRKLNETRKALAEVEAAHASATNAVTSREKEKKWLKF